MDEWRQREEEAARQLEQLQATREEEAVAAAAELARVRAAAEAAARESQAVYLAKMTALAERVEALESLKHASPFAASPVVAVSMSPAAAALVRTLHAPGSGAAPAGASGSGLPVATATSHRTHGASLARLPSLPAMSPTHAASNGAPAGHGGAAGSGAASKPVYAWQQGATPLLRPLRR
jgi:hypothetical protein